MTQMIRESRRSRVAPSRRGGVPTSVPPPARSPVRQLGLLPEPAPRAERREVLPGVVHVVGWLERAAQRALAEAFRRWALPPAGLRHPRMPSGHLMSVQSVCLGWHWSPYTYTRTADDTDGAPVKPLPAELAALGRAAVAAAYGAQSAAARRYAPDAAIVNLYAPGAKLGLHQDAEEPSEAPVVTISLGDSCVFRLAGVDRRSSPFTDLEFASGELIVFGGPNRRIYHGVPKVEAGTSRADVGLPPGRLSITLRETGLTT
jgi:alkylated DNA repair protein (DNA oxidative demethylase)